jgi:hypothetical protein
MAAPLLGVNGKIGKRTISPGGIMLGFGALGASVHSLIIVLLAMASRQPVMRGGGCSLPEASENSSFNCLHFRTRGNPYPTMVHLEKGQDI